MTLRLSPFFCVPKKNIAANLSKDNICFPTAFSIAPDAILVSRANRTHNPPARADVPSLETAQSPVGRFNGGQLMSLLLTGFNSSHR